MPVIVHMDFEVSGVAELPKVGADVWTKRKDTYPTLLSFAIDNDPVDTFVFDSRNHHLSTAGVRDRLAVVTDPHVEVHAWNAAFEFMVWNNICVPRYKWPPIPLDRFHCTMAQAACAGLPMSLDQASQAVQTGHLKDTVGARNMKRLARPRRDDPQEWWHLSDDKLAKENFIQLIEYNRNDVETERAIFHVTPRMSVTERAIWLIDQRMQAAGLPVDLTLLGKLAALTEAELHRLNMMLDASTCGAVSSVTQHARLLQWVTARGYHNPTQKPRKSAAGLITYPHTLERESLSEYLHSREFRTLAPVVRDVLTIRYEAAKTSTAKLNSMRNFAQIDGCARYLAQYGGAVRTLRWAGRGPQVQNFPRPIVKDVPGAIDAILSGADTQALDLLWGKPLDVVSSCLRGLFKAPPGKKLVVCDYSQIEARIVAWLSLHGDMLQVFADPTRDIYVYAASQQGSDNRQFGKVLVLACGFGMGGPKFRETASKYGIDLSEDQAIAAVNGWREANWPVVAAWRSAEGQAMRAIQNPGMIFPVNGRFSFGMANPAKKLRGALLLTLPSKRNLIYRNARIEDGGITYDGVNQYTRKWETLKTYGGKLCVAGDMLVLTERGWLRLDAIASERVWDGVEWVSHDGVICNGVRETISLDGVRLTPDHEVLTTEGWRVALSCEGLDRASVELPDGCELSRFGWQEIAMDRSLRLRKRKTDISDGVLPGESQILWLRTRSADSVEATDAWHEQAPSLLGLALDAGPLSASDTPSVEELRRAWDHSLLGVEKLQEILAGYGADLPVRANVGAQRQQRRIFGGQLHLGNTEDELAQYAAVTLSGHALGAHHGSRGVRPQWDRGYDTPVSAGARCERVFDILNAGYRHRFVVAGRSGPVILSNCENATQATARDLLAGALIDLDRAGYGGMLRQTVHDEIIAVTDENDAPRLLNTMKNLMVRPPDWAQGLPITVSGYIAERYRK